MIYYTESVGDRLSSYSTISFLIIVLTEKNSIVEFISIVSSIFIIIEEYDAIHILVLKSGTMSKKYFFFIWHMYTWIQELNFFTFCLFQDFLIRLKKEVNWMVILLFVNTTVLYKITQMAKYETAVFFSISLPKLTQVYKD